MTELCQNHVKGIQGDSGGKVSILECDRVGHCKKICSCEHLSNSEWLSVDLFASTNAKSL